MMLRTLLFVFFSVAAVHATDTLRTGGDSCQVVVDSNGKQIDRICKSVSLFKPAPVFPGISWGIGVPAVTVNAKTGGIGFLSSVDPVQLCFNGIQRKWIRNSEAHNFAFWVTEVGLSLAKTDSGSFTIGASIVPWAVRIDAVTFGIGVKWTAVNQVHALQRRDLSFVIPVTYSVF